MSAETLKPCPFCGQETERESRTGCDDPDCCGGQVRTYPELWNTRPLEAELRGYVDRLLECCGDQNLKREIKERL